MARYDDTFADRFLEPWNRHDVDGALAVMTDDCVWEVTRGREPQGTLYKARRMGVLGSTIANESDEFLRVTSDSRESAPPTVA
jgi:ketosteroid isomerase-like protein